jgi:hypothetical protein
MNASTERSPRAVGPANGGRRPWFRHPVVRVVGGGVGAVGGGTFALLAAAFGHCAAFGGRCPAVPPPPHEDDVFGGLAVGLAVLVASLVLAVRPDRRGLRLVAILLPVGVLPTAYVLAAASHRGTLL